MLSPFGRGTFGLADGSILIGTDTVRVVIGLYFLEFEKLVIIYGFYIRMSVDLHLPFIYFHGLFDNGDLLHCEFYAAQLDDVATLHHIVNLLVVVL